MAENQIRIKYLTQYQVSLITGFSISKLSADRAKAVGIPFSKIGRLIRYSEHDVVEFMEARKVAVDGDLEYRQE